MNARPSGAVALLDVQRWPCAFELDERNGRQRASGCAADAVSGTANND
jgi:hypothetical protein